MKSRDSRLRHAFTATAAELFMCDKRDLAGSVVARDRLLHGLVILSAVLEVAILFWHTLTSLSVLIESECCPETFDKKSTSKAPSRIYKNRRPGMLDALTVVDRSNNICIKISGSATRSSTVHSQSDDVCWACAETPMRAYVHFMELLSLRNFRHSIWTISTLWGYRIWPGYSRTEVKLPAGGVQVQEKGRKLDVLQMSPRA